ncbi:MAG: choice-of-anchor Q domain-containing protein [Chloroflexota bacterium]
MQTRPVLNHRLIFAILFGLVAFVASNHFTAVAKAAVPSAVTQIGTEQSQYSSSSTLSNFTVAAGTDRLLVVAASHTASTDVTSVTFDGTAMTEILFEQDSFASLAYFILPMGTSTTATTGNIVMSHHVGGQTTPSDEKYIAAVAFQNVDQTTPTEPGANTDCFDQAAGEPQVFCDDGQDVVNYTSEVTITSKAGDLAIAHFTAWAAAQLPSITVDSGQTVLHAQLGGATTNPNGGAGHTRYVGTIEDGDTSVTSTITASAGANVMTTMHITMNLNAAFFIAPDPEPSSDPANFTATANSESQILTTWTDASSGQTPHGYLVLCSTSNSFTTPTDGFPVADDTNCADGAGAQTVAQGTQTAVWSSLNAETHYFFTIFPYTNPGIYTDFKTDSPATDDATTLPVEPTNHPTGFTAVADTNTQITTTWTDAAGSPDGYLVTCVLNSVGTTPPGDGPLVSDNAAACGSGAVGSINIGPSIGTYSWTGLVPGSIYRFDIYPYNEANGIANYKTDSNETTTESTGCPASPISVTDSNTLIIGVNCYNLATAGTFVLNIDQDFTLAAMIPDVNNGSGVLLQINGNDYTIDGANTYRPFKITNGTVVIDNIMLINGRSPNNECHIHTCGGAVFVGENAVVTINDSTMYDNEAAAGGAILADGLFTLNNSTVYNNDARWGGAIYVWDEATTAINNSTLSGNTSTEEGGAIFANGIVALTNATVAENSSDLTGDALFIQRTTATIKNSIISNSNGKRDCDDFVGTWTTSNSLSRDNSCQMTRSSTINLGPLQDNGGPTLTHALLAGSSAVDTGNNGVCLAAPINNVDQRGTARPQGARCDAGAFEQLTAVSPTLSINSDPALEWTPAQSACTNTLWYDTIPYGTYMVYNGTPESFDVATPMTSSTTNYFWYLEVTCDTSAQSNTLGEFTFDIVPGS